MTNTLIILMPICVLVEKPEIAVAVGVGTVGNAIAYIVVASTRLTRGFCASRVD